MNDKNIAIEFKNISKEYKLCKKSRNNILNIFLKKNVANKKVLDNISFSINKGDTIAILGKNGMGKSTIIKLLSEISYPTSGEITINGNVNSIIELNTGFEKEFTGRENIYLKCRILGLKKHEIENILNPIIEFADLGEYIDQPLRTYSSGMRARLGFAINVHIKHDILAIDEVFSVGDYKFKQKCLNKIKEIKNSNNITFILVTHSPELAQEFCNKGILLHNSKIIYNGDINTCIKKYLEL